MEKIIKIIEEHLLSDKNILTINKEIKKNGILDIIYENFDFLKNKKISQLIWHFKNKVYKKVTCKCCDNDVRYVDLNRGYVKYCSNKCQLKDYWTNISKEKIKKRNDNIKNTCIKKYGVENITQTSYYKNKTKETSYKKYGTSHYLKNERYKKNLKKSLLKKYGVDNISKLDETKNKKHIKFINRTEQQKIDMLNKTRKTNLERYGVEHLSQDSDFLEKLLKKSFSYKSYRLPSGKIISLQGYEPQVLSYLLNKYDENDILFKNKDIENRIGKLFYVYENKNHRYYPDLYIISENKIIEVKSIFTYNLDIEKNQLKKITCLQNNIDFEFCIYDEIVKKCNFLK